jgi:hypothetical protein
MAAIQETRIAGQLTNAETWQFHVTQTAIVQPCGGTAALLQSVGMKNSNVTLKVDFEQVWAV